MILSTFIPFAAVACRDSFLPFPVLTKKEATPLSVLKLHGPAISPPSTSRLTSVPLSRQGAPFLSNKHTYMINKSSG